MSISGHRLQYTALPAGEDAAESAMVARNDLSPHSAANTSANVDRNRPVAPALTIFFWIKDIAARHPDIGYGGQYAAFSFGLDSI